MSGLAMRRAWLSSVALVAVFGVAACGDDDDDVGTPMAGSAGKDMGGAPGDGGAPSGGNPTAGKAGMGGKGGMGGNAGKGGMAVGGDDQGMAGEGGAPSAGGAAGGAGGDGGAVISLADEVRSKLAGTSPLPAVPADTTNAFADNAGAATLGQALFFDEKFSGAMTADNDLGTTGQLNKVSCASCHDGKVLDDTRSSPATVSKGTGTHTRNSPAVVNSAFYTWTNWGGRFSAQWELPLVVVENGAIMNGTRLQVAHRLYSAYKAQYEAVFGAFPADISNETRFPATGKPTQATFDNMTADDKTIVNRILVNYSKALQAYMRKLLSREAPFDAFMAGDDDALTEAQLEGARSFVDRGCTTCHNGATFSDQIFHDLGVPQTGDNVPATDDGRFANMPALVATTNIFSRNGDFSDDKNTGKLASIPVPPAEVPADWKGQFRTPSLRGVASSAPYMHSGQLATLSDVLDFYAAGGTATTATGQLTGFTFQAGEKEKMIDFLGTLSGKDIAESLLTDTSAP